VGSDPQDSHADLFIIQRKKNQHESFFCSSCRAFEALTVIKLSVAGQLFSSYKRTGKCKKLNVLYGSNNRNPTKTHSPKEKTFSKLSETVKQRFQNKKPSEHSDPPHDDIEILRK